MESLTFKYFGLESIYEVTSKELMDNIEFLQNSKIDAIPIFQTSDSLLFNEKIIKILNYKQMDDLATILRKNKLKKLINNEDSSLNYEFLEFWYNNSDKLHLLIPIKK